MLTKSFIIFVCTFDFYQKGRHIYRFENLCTDDTSIRFGDETIKVVLNTKGTLNDVSDEMLELLAYIDNGQVTNSFTQELDREVNSVRNNEKWRREYMTLMMALEEKKQEGREEGREEGILNTIEICLDLNLDDDEIAKRVSEKFNIPEDTIKEKYLKDK